MSYETWNKEFMPILANQVEEEDAGAYIEHKWIGGRPENLARHGITSQGLYTSNNCPWCLIARSKISTDYFGSICHGCPAVIAGAGVCDGPDSPYAAFYNNGDVEPMIAWVKKARKLIEKQETEK